MGVAIIKRGRNQAEFTKAIWDYLDTAVSDLRIANGRKALDKWDETLNAIVDELREGLNSSYRKLRELLVTFRSHSDEPGLIPSVKVAADEINRISQNTKIHLYIDDNWPEDLSPSQEIHCLHVIREALTNVIKHAQAENAVVSLKVKDQEQLEIKINDDGIGFDESPEKPMHYGLTIMHERAQRIAGTIEYQRLNYGGAGVTLTFKPKYKNEEEILSLQNDSEAYNDKVIWPDKVKINLKSKHKETIDLIHY